MKKLTLFSLPLHARLPRVLVTAAFIGVCLSGTALAEEKVWEIQSGNVLSKIVAEHYPGYANTQAIMQEILKRNPTAFSKPDVNSLIVGKTLTLPDAKDIPELEPPPPDPSPPPPGRSPPGPPGAAPWRSCCPGASGPADPQKRLPPRHFPPLSALPETALHENA